MCVLLGLTASLDLEIDEMDVTTPFLHGDMQEEVHMEQPEGFVVKGKKDHVYRLSKSLYGLKQASRQWYKKFEFVMKLQGYKKTKDDHCMFVKNFSADDFIILLLYVDDMLIVGKSASRIDKLKKQLSQSFSIKDMGPIKKILGIKIDRDKGAKKLCISQEKYIKKVLQRFNMNNAKVVSSTLTSHFKLRAD
ncbi:Retrovirus-related Pol polyprotein from transposon TNT 1-94-like protein [Drosera capensis]